MSEGETEVPMHFGKHLHALREERGLSIRQMAKRIGVAHSQLIRWLGQRHAPKSQTLERISRGLGVPVTLLLPPGNKNDTTPEKAALLEHALKNRNEILESKLQEYWETMDSQNCILEKVVNFIALANKQNGGKFNGIFLEVNGAIHDHKMRKLFDHF